MRFSNLLVVLTWLAVSGAPTGASSGASMAASAAAVFAAGVAAYDGGVYRTAFEQWRALAEAGDAEAQTALAGLYFAGLGAPEDAAEAVRWYRRAAEQGEPVAQQNLGDFYQRGIGVERDPVSAYVWLSLAAAQGRSWSVRRRDEVAAQLTPAQRAEAEARLAARPKGP